MFKRIKIRSLLGNAWVLFFCAVLVAGGLTFVLYRYLSEREMRIKAEAAGHQQRAGVEVVVPSRDVPAGTPLSSGDFVAREVAGDLVYDDMVRVEDFDTYRTSHLVKAVRRGRPLRAGDIDVLRGRDFADILPAGQRALTLEIDTVNSTATMVRPGNRVDLYWVGKNPDPQPVSVQSGPSGTSGQSGDGKAIRLLMPNVLILATGQDIRPRDAGEAMERADNPQSADNYSTVTVQVPIADAPRIVLAQKVGSLRLILKNADDATPDVPQKLTEDKLFANAGGSGGNASLVEIITGGGSTATTLVPGGPSDAMPAAAGASPRARTPVAPASDNALSGAPRPGAYEQANAIAQQLQKLDTRTTSDRN
jgi:pilus assembly protein CpaB